MLFYPLFFSFCFPFFEDLSFRILFILPLFAVLLFVAPLDVFTGCSWFLLTSTTEYTIVVQGSSWIASAFDFLALS